MHLLREACLFDDHKITTYAVNQSIQSLVRQYDRSIQDRDLDKLVEVHRQKTLKNDPDFGLLAYHLLVLEYENDDYWADVHPAVQRNAKFQEALQADGPDQVDSG